MEADPSVQSFPVVSVSLGIGIAGAGHSRWFPFACKNLVDAAVVEDTNDLVRPTGIVIGASQARNR